MGILGKILGTICAVIVGGTGVAFAVPESREYISNNIAESLSPKYATTLDLTKSQQEKIVKLEKEKANLQAEVNNKDAQIITLTTDKANLQKQINDKNTQITNLETNITNLTLERDTLLTDKANLQNQLTAVQNDNNTKAETIANLQSQITNKDNQIATLNSQIETLTQEKTTLTTQVNNLNVQIETLNNQITTLETKKAQLESEIATLKNNSCTITEEPEIMICGYSNDNFDLATDVNSSYDSSSFAGVERNGPISMIQSFSNFVNDENVVGYGILRRYDVEISSIGFKTQEYGAVEKYRLTEETARQINFYYEDGTLISAEELEQIKTKITEFRYKNTIEYETNDKVFTKFIMNVTTNLVKDSPKLQNTERVQVKYQTQDQARSTLDYYIQFNTDNTIDIINHAYNSDRATKSINKAVNFEILDNNDVQIAIDTNEHFTLVLRYNSNTSTYDLVSTTEEYSGTLTTLELQDFDSLYAGLSDGELNGDFGDIFPEP